MPIKLNRGLYALVDGDDYNWLSRWKWCLLKGRSTFYAARKIRIGKHKQRTIYMHREILNIPKSSLTDHINDNGLDNRKINLRICNINQNSQNQRPQQGKTSKYKGVTFHNKSKLWRARIVLNKKDISLGYFKDETKAAQAYDKAAKELFGEFARTNMQTNI